MKCDSNLLWTLVEQFDEPTDEIDRIADHVTVCEACQSELVSIAGGDQWLLDSHPWLVDAVQHSDSTHCKNAEIESLDVPAEESFLHPIDMSFLDPPGHPEMLGRIGRYDVEGILGRGGMGVVFRGYDSQLGRSVAVKVMAPEWAAFQPARDRFAREAQAAASVAHENVVPIFNVDATAKLPYIVMRLINGQTLQQLVDSDGPLEPETLLRIAGQLTEGLAAAHRRGLIHRDVKPANVLVGENSDRVWITDFGLARAADSVMLTQTGVVAGTPHYMSPEQTRGQKLDPRSDLFSLGSLFYFAATGQTPFSAENTLGMLHQIASIDVVPLDRQRPDLPPAFTDLVNRLMQKELKHRPNDAERVAESIATAHEQLSAGISTSDIRAAQRRRRRIIFGFIVACSLMVVAGFLKARSALSSNQPGVSGQALTESEAQQPALVAADDARPLRPKLPKASPYVSATVNQITQSYRMDERSFAERTRKLSRQIDQLQQKPPGLDVVLPLTVSERDAEAARLKRAIERLAR